MRTIYIECSMGIAGDMLMGALYELLDDTGRNEFIRSINSAGIPEVTVRAAESIKCGVKGTHMELPDINQILYAGTCRKARITPLAGNMRLCTDGEIVDAGAIDFEVVPEAFNLLLPAVL